LTGLEDIESTKEQEVLDSLAVLLSAGWIPYCWNWSVNVALGSSSSVFLHLWNDLQKWK